MMGKFPKYILAALSIAFAGCGADEVVTDTADPDVPAAEEVTLCLDVSFEGTTRSTRADLGPDYYEDPTGDFEKINGFRVIIFRDVTEVDGVTTGVVEGNRMVTTTPEGHPINDNLEFKVLANQKKRIYLIANEKFLTPPPGYGGTLNPSASVFLDSYVPCKPTENKRSDIDVLTNWTVSTAGVNDAENTVTTGIFGPSLLGEQTDNRLPLTEFFDVEVGTKEQTTDDRWFSHLFLTRCAAKARFFLNVGDNFKAYPDVDGNPVIKNPLEISSISLSGVGTKEYVFPNKTKYSIAKEELINKQSTVNWTFEDAYIKEFATPDDNKLVTYFVGKDYLMNTALTPTTDNTAEDMLQYPLTKAPIYFAESILTEQQKYVVTVTLGDGSEFKAPLETNVLSINGRDAISRNTYLPIILNFTGAGEFTVEVLPWNTEVNEFDFSDHVGMSNDGALAFTENTYPEGGLDKKEGRLVLPEYPNAVEGHFTIGAPENRKWDAYLVTKTGEPNAIQFVVIDDEGNPVLDKNGNLQYTGHISGTVGEAANFKVAATMSAGTAVREAIMQVVVTLDYGGITVPVNVLEGGGYGADGKQVENVSFIQNPK